MGLLQKLSETGLEPQKNEQPVVDKPVILKKSNSVGLLKKSLQASENRRLDFFEFTGKYNLQICAILKNVNGTYKIQNCIGFDGESVCLSVSTPDFWDGTITQIQNLYSYDITSSQSLPFFQFFSNELKPLIKTISIIKTQNESIFLICNNTITPDSDFFLDLEVVENTETDFTRNQKPLISNSFAHCFELNFSEALESFILSNSKNNAEFSKVILNELYYNLYINFPEPEKIEYSKNGIFTLGVSEEIPVELLYNHLRIECGFVLGKHSELISVNQLEAAK